MLHEDCGRHFGFLCCPVSTSFYYYLKIGIVQYLYLGFKFNVSRYDSLFRNLIDAYLYHVRFDISVENETHNDLRNVLEKEKKTLCKICFTNRLDTARCHWYSFLVWKLHCLFKTSLTNISDFVKNVSDYPKSNYVTKENMVIFP